MDGAQFGGSSKTTCYDFAAYDAFANIFDVEAANNDKDRSTAYRLRYQIYCVENPFEDPAQFPDGKEKDHLDYRAVHGLVRHRKSGIACGTTRLILPTDDETAAPAGFFDVCRSGAFLPRATTAEISRFATSKAFRERCMGFPDTRMFLQDASLLPLLTISLMAFTIQQAALHRITHLCAVMKPPLIRLLHRFGVHCHPVGPLVDYHGLRQPCYLPMDQLLADIGVEQPALWDIITDSGRILEAQRAVEVA